MLQIVLTLAALSALVGVAFGAQAAKAVIGFSLIVVGGGMSLLVFSVLFGIIQ